MSEPTLFDATPAPTNGRVTSTEAAEHVTPKAGRLRARVLMCLDRTDGLTDEQVQERTSMPASTERPRRVELVRDGYVTEVGFGLTRSGRRAIRWGLTDKGALAAGRLRVLADRLDGGA